MILTDTGALVALIDRRDGLHRRARADLSKLSEQPLLITLPILGETFFHFRSRAARRSLRALLEELEISIHAIGDSTVNASMNWLERYADHEPDFADAITVVLSSELEACRVWTYDREFRTIWRRLDGSAIPMAVR